jgi:hypothetical protein
MLCDAAPLWGSPDPRHPMQEAGKVERLERRVATLERVLMTFGGEMARHNSEVQKLFQELGLVSAQPAQSGCMATPPPQRPSPPQNRHGKAPIGA